MFKNNLLFALCLLAVFVLLFNVFPLFKIEFFDADVMRANGWTQHFKPNYYGMGTWGYHYGDPYYYRKGEQITYED